MYGTLHGTYKKALRKALQTKSSSLRLIGILEDFANENSGSEDEDEELDEEECGESDKENDATVFQLRNPKIRRGKGRPAGTKRYKASIEKERGEKTKQQRRCKKCGSLGHYQKKCNA